MEPCSRESKSKRLRSLSPRVPPVEKPPRQLLVCSSSRPFPLALSGCSFLFNAAVLRLADGLLLSGLQGLLAWSFGLLHDDGLLIAAVLLRIKLLAALIVGNEWAAIMAS
ncbi:hypothetical protein Dimus_037720 [Dionaea muscipula]